VADKLFPVVPDTGTEKAARLANEVTGDPGRWIRLDCQHLRHVQHPVEDGEVLECPTCPPSTGGILSFHRVEQGPRRSLANVDDVGRVVSRLVANAIGHAEASVELIVDTSADVVRVEVRDDAAALSGTGRVVSLELRDHDAG
jgi:signal transduction histidine kinase